MRIMGLAFIGLLTVYVADTALAKGPKDCSDNYRVYEISSVSEWWMCLHHSRQSGSVAKSINTILPQQQSP
jgi:hypothetical protein